VNISILLFSLIISSAVLVLLFRGRPNLFVFQLIQKVFGEEQKEVNKEECLHDVTEI